jgi:hypothetical protein
MLGLTGLRLNLEFIGHIDALGPVGDIPSYHVGAGVALFLSG